MPNPPPDPAAAAAAAAQQAVAAAPQQQVVTVYQSIRPERFDTDEPIIWFIQFEAMMRLYHVPEAEKYDLLIASLHKAARTPVSHQLSTPPDDASTRYTWLKDLLIAGHSKSSREKLQQLLLGESIGDRKPTVFLADLRALAPENMDDELVREFWWKGLSAPARGILSAFDQKKTDTNELAAAADNVYKELGEKISAISHRQPQQHAATSAAAPQLDQMALLIEALKGLVAQLSSGRSRSRSRPQQHNRGQSRSQSRPRTAQQKRTPRTDGMCYYHAKFKEEARCCEDPCAWPKN